MAIYPRGEYRPLGKQTEPRMSRHTILCFHTMVGYLMGTDSMFKRDGYYGVESHFGVGGSSDGRLDGHTIQWQDTAYRADANLDGKPEVVSIETSDGGNPNQPWSSDQIDELVRLGIWVCKTHDIPPVLIPDTQPGRRGIGYHRMGCDHGSSYRPKGWPYDKWREPGGVKWSNVRGKVCPGDVRIKQLVDIVIPRIKAGMEGDDMPTADEIAKAVWTRRMDNPHHPPGTEWQYNSFLKWGYAHSLTAVREVRALGAAVAANNAAIDALAKALAEHDGNLDPEAFAAAVREASEAGAKAALESIPLAAVLVKEETGEEEPA